MNISIAFTCAAIDSKKGMCYSFYLCDMICADKYFGQSVLLIDSKGMSGSV